MSNDDGLLRYASENAVPSRSLKQRPAETRDYFRLSQT